MKERVLHNNYGAQFTQASLERTLDIHKEAGIIRSWKRNTDFPLPAASRRDPSYTVTLFDYTNVDLGGLWEVHAFLAGVASTRRFHEEQERLARIAADAAAAERDRRLAAEKELEARVTREAECPFCGQAKGASCVRIHVQDLTPYANKPHSARYDAAGLSHLAPAV